VFNVWAKFRKVKEKLNKTGNKYFTEPTMKKKEIPE
jgi:hypothetical protein